MAFAAACDDTDTTQAAMTSASEQSIEFCGAPSVDEVGFTTFTDGTTGFTDECAAQMASIQPEPEPVADVNREAEVEIEAEPAPAPVPETQSEVEPETEIQDLQEAIFLEDLVSASPSEPEDVAISESASTTAPVPAPESPAPALALAPAPDSVPAPAPEPVPAPKPAPAPAPKPEPPAPVPAPASPSAYYPNCAAARAAGAAPLYEGDSGYSLRLDRDRDGIACE